MNDFINVNDLDISTINRTEIKIKNNTEYYNMPLSFDIETTSFYDDNGEKRAFMYIWQMSINGIFIYGRTWKEFDTLLNDIATYLNLTPSRKCIIYVHNLGYEFQFLRGHFDISNVFARNERHPIKFDLNGCFEFRCSLLLSGMNLQKTAENLTSVKLQKMVGDLDYEKIRTNSTPLTEEEMGYCKRDVEILHYFILEEMAKNENDITKIPLTKTGYVRQFCYNWIKNNTKIQFYKKNIEKIAPLDEDFYCTLYKAFSGGDTHANYLNVFEVIDNVHSFDLTSSYPTQQIGHKYPIQPFIQTNVKDMNEFKKLINSKPCVFQITIYGVKAKTSYHTISKSKCPVLDSKAIIDNGRVVQADYLTTYMTDIDFIDFEKFYNYRSIIPTNIYSSFYGYLPKEYITSILHLYEQKTTLKNVLGKEVEYLVSKGMLNSIYGMSVTNPVTDEITFTNNEWGTKPKLIETALFETYIKNKKTVSVFQWGVWCTAWARHELRQAILELGDDLVYCDTDSVKFINLEKHKNWFEKYNIEIVKRLTTTLEYYDIPLEKMKPKNIKGEECQLGLWDYEGKYDKFKTLGAKRYAFLKDGKYNITVSGINKKTAVPYMENYCKEYGINFFDMFCDDMCIPADYSGRSTFTYIDNKPFKLMVTDYLGHTKLCAENSYVHSEKSETHITLADEFIKYVYGGGFSGNFGNSNNKMGKYDKKLCTTPWLSK